MEVQTGSEKSVNILFIGDIIGKPGRTAVAELIKDIFEKESIDFCIANAENAAGGFGVTPEVANQLLSLDIDVLTSGNHIWDKKEIMGYLDTSKNLLRPVNYPPSTPGSGYCVVEMDGGIKIGVLNIGGRVFNMAIDCPFRKGLGTIKRMRLETPIIIVDFHGEATSEKSAFAWYVDGLASAVIGTHTHIQTADERIMPKGTAYLTDVGMVGAYNSVIGTRPEDAIERFLTQRPIRFRVAAGLSIFNACVIKINVVTGKAISISRIYHRPSSLQP
jgi:2',3'-cyclic-nucleotide 2'-phosphodiesterase